MREADPRLTPEDISSENRDGVQIIKLPEIDLDAHAAKAFKHYLNDIIEKPEPIKGLVVDLENVHFIDSTALGVLLEVFDQCERRETPFQIDLSKNKHGVYRMFEITGLNGVLDLITEEPEKLEEH